MTKASDTHQLRIVQLYPDQMNIYGDMGNVQVVAKRARLYGFDPAVVSYNSYADRDELAAADIILGGGGQDSGQRQILTDLGRVKPLLLQIAEDKTPILVICGLYQLFGHWFKTKDGDTLPGIGLFDLTTTGGDRRLIGNAIIDAGELGQLVGYENHSGVTTLGDEQAPLGQVVQGYGNDGLGLNEGAIKYATIGTYLHGPVLPKNPCLADFLISRAAERRYDDGRLTPADDEAKRELAKLDSLAAKARQVAADRPQ